MTIRNYKSFKLENVGFGPMLLPAHKEPENKASFTLKELLDIEGSIDNVGNRINAAIKLGYYITVDDGKSKNSITYHNLPSVIFGVTGGRTISVGYFKNITISNDSLIIYISSENALFILSTDYEYIINFIKPKVVISDHDPYGEEDWDEN